MVAGSRVNDSETWGYVVSTDPKKLDIKVIHHFLNFESGWGKGIPLETLKISIENSLTFGLYKNERQIGFARVVTDFATFAHLCDVFICPEYQRRGLSKLLMDSIFRHPRLQGLKRWTLVTQTAEWLYEKYDFRHLANSEFYMEKVDPEAYRK